MYEKLRKEMVEKQLIARNIKDKRVLEAFYNVPREEFVPEKEKPNAYNDYPIHIGLGQTISQPYMVALMTEVLNPQENEKILEIGTGSGYQAAILSYLKAEVYSIERLEELYKRAKEVLDRLGYKVNLKLGDGTLGWKEFAPFDKIIITAASFEIPLPLIEQVKEGGIIVAPIGGTLSQDLTVAKKVKGSLEKKIICGCVFVPLIGKYGYQK